MDLPKLTDISPELAEAKKQLNELTVRQDEIRANYRRLIQQKTNGQPPADQQARVQAILAGAPVPPPSNIDLEIANEQANYNATEAAKAILAQRVVSLESDAGRKICAQVKPKHDAAMKRLSTALVDVHAAYTELHGMKRALLNNGCGLHGIFDLQTDFMEMPLDKASSLAYFFRGAKAAGYISSVPKELR